jgi:uncharacterized protein YwqG
MNGNKIEFIKETSSNSKELRIGGRALLPENTAWPTNPNGTKLTLIASLPCLRLNSLLENMNYPQDSFVSVFSTYNKEDYFLDLITYHGDEAELNNIKKGYTKVILHQEGNERNDSDTLIPARLIEISSEITNDFYTASKVCGIAGLLQKNPLNINDYCFCLQLYSADFPEGYDDVFYLTDAVGYLFLNSNVTKEDMGIFFAQTT